MSKRFSHLIHVIAFAMTVMILAIGSVSAANAAALSPLQRCVKEAMQLTPHRNFNNWDRHMQIGAGAWINGRWTVLKQQGDNLTRLCKRDIAAQPLRQAGVEIESLKAQIAAAPKIDSNTLAQQAEIDDLKNENGWLILFTILFFALAVGLFLGLMYEFLKKCQLEKNNNKLTGQVRFFQEQVQRVKAEKVTLEAQAKKQEEQFLLESKRLELELAKQASAAADTIMSLEVQLAEKAIECADMETILRNTREELENVKAQLTIAIDERETADTALRRARRAKPKVQVRQTVVIPLILNRSFARLPAVFDPVKDRNARTFYMAIETEDAGETAWTHFLTEGAIKRFQYDHTTPVGFLCNNQPNILEEERGLIINKTDGEKFTRSIAELERRMTGMSAINVGTGSELLSGFGNQLPTLESLREHVFNRVGSAEPVMAPA